MNIPVLRPLLPSMDRVSPYLRRIDATRLYSNFGPLSQELESRLAERLGLPADGVTTVANATVGLTVALQAMSAPAGSLCLMPAWTFVATPLAALAAGLTPWFLDVSADDWALTPDICRAALGTLPGEVGGVIPVAPFGQPLSLEPWERFHAETGVPVVIDAAAGFDAQRAGSVPAVVSLHATKALGCGEGGFVVCTDGDLIRRIRAHTGFGFLGSRNAQVAGRNAKMSEYHAAVALAALDGWEATRAALAEGARCYGAAFAGSNLVRLQRGFGSEWVATTCMVELLGGDNDGVEAHLLAEGTDCRRWWGMGAHRHDATSGFGRSPLPVTSALGRRTLGLPFYADLPPHAIATVAQQVLAALEQ